MTRITFPRLQPSLLALCLATTPVIAADNANYTPGDLVLFFQQEGGSNTVYANLGNAATLYRGAAAGPGAANRVSFLNISAALTTAFGAGWASDSTIYAGLAGVWGTDSGTALQNGDPSRTLYVSASRDDVGTVGQASSAGYSFNTNTGMTSIANGILQQNLPFDVSYTDAVVVSPTGVSNIDNQNPFSALGIQGTAFGNIGGGVQQAGTAGSFGTYGAAGSVEFALDLYRVLATNSISGQVAGGVRQGSYEGTVTVNSSGMVSFISQGAAGGTPLQNWALTFPALDTAAKQLPSADPDNDGLTNLMEFVLNGNPGTFDPAVRPTLNSAGSNFVFTFNRRDDSEAGTTLLFQYSSNLSDWTDAAIGAASSVSGSANIVVTQNATTDTINVTVPKSVSPSGKIFGRLKASQ